MLENIEVLCHSSIRINKPIVIYVDPFRINTSYNDADYIFITHDHYDHFSKDDIMKVKKDTTVIIVPTLLENDVLDIGFESQNIITVLPNEVYKINDSISFETIPAYNVNKQFHPKEKDYVGYNITIDNLRYYIAGDADINDENLKVECDIAFIPIGGTYTMDYKEAAIFTNKIKPKYAIPTHYGEIVGNSDLGDKYIQLLDNNIIGKCLIKQKI